MVRLKIAVAAGVLAGGLAMPSAASADTTQIVYASGYNAYGQAGADPAIAGDHVLSAVPVQGAAANVTQLAGGTGRKGGTSVLSLRSDGTVWGWGRTGRLFLTAALRAGHREPAPGGPVPAGTPGPDSS